jgi:hypothetical protein
MKYGDVIHTPHPGRMAGGQALAPRVGAAERACERCGFRNIYFRALLCYTSL